MSVSFESLTASGCVEMPTSASHSVMNWPASTVDGFSVRTMNRKSSGSPPPGISRTPSPSVSW